MNNLSIETEDSFASMFELAANNDIDGFKKWIEREPLSIDEVGVWYIRIPGSKKLVLEQRTPLMVAATYGSIDVLKLIISSSGADINRSCGNTKSTALHCAASGGSDNAVEVVKLLLAAGADPNLADRNGQRPIDVIVVSPKSPDVKMSLQKLLAVIGSSEGKHSSFDQNHVLDSSSLQRNESQSSVFCSYLLKDTKFEDVSTVSGSEKKEYPIDPNFPDIKNSIYGTDEFRMYSFKVRPCSRAYSHDWTECPFVHPGENARRRDPRKFHYSCVPCPDFRKGTCRRGDMCEYAHGVFECWLHPAQYRTRICKDGTDCTRRVCFFAHTPEELRPLYVSTGSAVPSPHSNYSSAMDFAAAMMLPPGSPSSGPVMPTSPFTPPLSPNGSPSQQYWPPNTPTLNLPGSSLQSSRLRSSFNARDIPTEDFAMMGESDTQKYQMLNSLTGQYGANFLERPGRVKTPAPLNLEDLFAADSLSPRYADSPFASSVHSPTHKSALLNQYQQQRQGMLSPINTNIPANNVDHHLLQGSYGVPYSGIVSPRNMEPISPMNSRVSMLANNRDKLRSVSFREPGTNIASITGSPLSSNWGSFSGKLDWALSSEELDKLRRSSSFDMRNSREGPDPLWARTRILDTAPEIRERAAVDSGLGLASSSEGLSSISSTTNSTDHPALGAWLEQMQLDELMSSSK